MIPDSVMARLKAAEWLTRPETQQLFALPDGRKGRTRAVGGIVRDTLLDRWRDRPEVDFATELKPDEVMRRAGERGIPVYPTGIEHGTVTLKLGDLIAEVTTLREDVETDGRRATVAFYHRALGGVVRPEHLIATESMVASRSRTQQNHGALRRYFQGLIHPVRPAFMEGTLERVGDRAAGAGAASSWVLPSMCLAREAISECRPWTIGRACGLPR